MDGRYERVVFMQGDDAREPLNLLYKKSAAAAIKYMAQWHTGESIGEHVATLRHGSSDRVYKKGGYILSANPGLGYISLDYDMKYKRRAKRYAKRKVY